MSRRGSSSVAAVAPAPAPTPSVAPAIAASTPTNAAAASSTAAVRQSRKFGAIPADFNKFTAMEELHDKLLVLDYESLFLNAPQNRSFTKKPLDSIYFTMNNGKPTEQFSYLLH